ncbi:hypothetical protein [Streptomyces sp. NPDC001508]
MLDPWCDDPENRPPKRAAAGAAAGLKPANRGYPSMVVVIVEGTRA